MASPHPFHEFNLIIFAPNFKFLKTYKNAHAMLHRTLHRISGSIRGLPSHRVVVARSTSSTFDSSDLSDRFDSRVERASVATRNREMTELRKQFRREVEDKASEQKERERYVVFFFRRAEVRSEDEISSTHERTPNTSLYSPTFLYHTVIHFHLSL